MCFGGTFEIADQTEEREISVPESLLVLIGCFSTSGRSGVSEREEEGEGKRARWTLCSKISGRWWCNGTLLEKTRMKQEVRAWYEESFAYSL